MDQTKVLAVNDPVLRDPSIVFSGLQEYRYALKYTGSGPAFENSIFNFIKKGSRWTPLFDFFLSFVFYLFSFVLNLSMSFGTTCL
jgi:hypothetical protein